MASTYSSLKIQLMGTGENSGTWGNVTNDNLGIAIEEAIAESADVTFSGSNVSISLTDSNSSQPARNLRLNLTGTNVAATQALTVPDIEKPYIINNGLSDDVEVKNSTGANVTVPAGKSMWVYSTGTGVVDVTTHSTSLTLGTPLAITQGGTGSNSATFSGANITSLNASNISAGVLGESYGGTGVSSLGSGVSTALGVNVGSAGAFVTFDGALGTPSSATLTNATGLPVSTGVSGLGTNVATFLGTPSSSNLANAITDETGSGSLVFGTSPTIGTATLTTPTITRGLINTTKEVVTVTGTAATGTINFDVLTQSILYYTANASGNWTINVRGDGSTSLDSIMSTGQSITVVFLATQGATAYYQTGFQIDGSAVTPKWQGGSAPTAGNTSGIDVYVIGIVKTGAATFTVFDSQTQFK